MSFVTFGQREVTKYLRAISELLIKIIIHIQLCFWHLRQWKEKLFAAKKKSKKQGMSERERRNRRK